MGVTALNRLSGVLSAVLGAWSGSVETLISHDAAPPGANYTSIPASSSSWSSRRHSPTSLPVRLERNAADNSTADTVSEDPTTAWRTWPGVTSSGGEGATTR